MLARIGEMGTPVHCGWDCIHTLVQPLWKKVPWKIKSRITILSCSSTFGYFSGGKKENKNVYWDSLPVVSVQLLSCRTAAQQASLSITNSWSLLKLMSIKLVMPSNRIILCHPLLPLSIFPSIRVLPRSPFFALVAKVLEFELQHKSFQWIFRPGFL